MAKIYLKRVKGGDCNNCHAVNGKKMCFEKFNKIDGQNVWKCVREDFHYIEVKRVD